MIAWYLDGMVFELTIATRRINSHPAVLIRSKTPGKRTEYYNTEESAMVETFSLFSKT